MPYSLPRESSNDAHDGISKDPESTESSRRLFLILTSVTAAIGGFLFGYDTAVISGAILFVRRDLQLTAAQTEFAVSIVLAGALIGAALGGYLGDRFGRRRTLVITAIAFGVFGLTTGLAEGLKIGRAHV